MSTITTNTGQPELAKPETMGVASLATKRHLESPIDGDEVVSAKIAKLNANNNNNNVLVETPIMLSSLENGESQIVQDSNTNHHHHHHHYHNNTNENSSELVTTSILARTLLTSSTSTAQYSSDPLESLKSSLEALPAPAILDTPASSPSYLSNLSGIGSNKSTIGQGGDLVGFGSLLGPERPLATAVTVLSPIDEDPIEWNNPAKATPVVNLDQHHPHHNHHSSTHHGMNPSISSLTSLVDHQLQQQLSTTHEVITEDENGKSYFNLGTPDSTILARRSSSDAGSWGGGSNGSCGGGSNNGNDFDDAISSSSCDSISSEDLFNSGEEFDASDDEDEDELCTYKQQRSTVLHLSLCKLNKFRTNCVEPSLHRSVLICNTLRHIEQEIRNEDEADESLKSRERLPSFWPSPPPSNNNPNSQNNCFPPHNNNSNNPGSTQGTQPSQPQITDTRPNGHIGGIGVGPLVGGGGGGIPSLIGGNGAPGGMLAPPNGGHDPYLSPNPYSESPYLTPYDYNSPRPTPFHTTSYDYEQDLLLPPPPNASPSSTAPSQASSSVLLSEVTSATSSLLECDSGYSDDLDMSLSSYYYGSPIPPPPVVVPVTSCSNNLLPPNPADFNVAMSSSNGIGASSSGAIQVSSVCTPPVTTQSDCGPYLPQCSSFQPLPPMPPPPQVTSVTDPVMSSHLLGGEHIALHSAPPPPPPPDGTSPMEISDLGDIEIRNSSSTSPPTSISSSHVGGASSPCEYTSMVSEQSSATSNESISNGNISCSSSANNNQSTWPVSNVEEQHKAITTVKDPSLSPEQLHENSSSSTTSQSPSNSPPHQSSEMMCPLAPTPTSSAAPSSLANAFAQQDSQCGLESRRSDLSRNVGNHYNNHNLPMDSLISPAYSSSSL
ncbi:unnamed protein product [Orchesella dallaii]|uniref:SERTA domain-containing protein n=1 Tax=Orchesella dallaii TaxID=48710 RepID=A0ABP1Q6V5_9HEXA